jgi:hypothetical protein
VILTGQLPVGISNGDDRLKSDMPYWEKGLITTGH